MIATTFIDDTLGHLFDAWLFALKRDNVEAAGRLAYLIEARMMEIMK